MPMLLLYSYFFLIRILTLQREGKSIRLWKLIKLTRPLPKSFITGSKKLLAENSSDTAFLMNLGHILVSNPLISLVHHTRFGYNCFFDQTHALSGRKRHSVHLSRKKKKSQTMCNNNLEASTLGGVVYFIYNLQRFDIGESDVTIPTH